MVNKGIIKIPRTQLLVSSHFFVMKLDRFPIGTHQPRGITPYSAEPSNLLTSPSMARRSLPAIHFHVHLMVSQQILDANIHSGELT